MKVGDKVIAMSHAENGVIYIFGVGIYAGQFVPPPDIGGLNLGLPNPRIDLDDGKTVWGCECWWGSVASIEEKFGNLKCEVVDIDDARTQAKGGK